MRKFCLLFLLCGCVNSTQNSYLFFDNPSVFLSSAERMVGMNEYSNRSELREFMGVDPVRYQWCAAFVNSILELHSIPGSESVSDNPLMARSFLDWGTVVDEPRVGDIVVFPRGNQGWQGHVGFYTETVIIDNVSYYVILGGNQNNQVSYDLYAANRAIGIRRAPTDSEE